jgi:serine/threonine protein kinase
VLSPEGEVLALKQVRLDAEPDGDEQLLTAVQNEIELMRTFKVRVTHTLATRRCFVLGIRALSALTCRARCIAARSWQARGLTKYIINLVDAEVNLDSQLVYMVMECGEIDLAGMLKRHWADARERDDTEGFNENFVGMYWEQMLRAVHAIHEARVIHGDLKPANFLCVRGALKLIDFGIAKTMANPDNTKIARENTVGTVNYMSPEAIYGDDDGQHKQGRASDVWSLGCILYQMVHGHTPFSHLKNLIQKMQAITNECAARRINSAAAIGHTLPPPLTVPPPCNAGRWPSTSRRCATSTCRRPSNRACSAGQKRAHPFRRCSPTRCSAPRRRPPPPHKASV